MTTTNEDLKKEIAELRKEIQELKIICSRMDGHITFVESVYQRLSAPLNYIASGFYSTSSEVSEFLE